MKLKVIKNNSIWKKILKIKRCINKEIIVYIRKVKNLSDDFNYLSWFTGCNLSMIFQI